MAKRKKKKIIVREISWDWRDTDDGIDQLMAELPKFGVYVYPHPATEGSDMYGLVLSSERLTRSQLRELEEDLM